MRIAVFLLVLLCGLWLVTMTSGQAAAPEDRPPQRVVLRVNRNTEIAGHIALEDSDTITIRNLKGEVESFPKSRISQIVRLVEPEPGQSGLVYMRDGGTREGVIIEDAFDHVLLEIEGIRAKLRRDVVSHVVLQPTFDERYAKAKSSLQPGMYDAHLTLCQWLFEHRRYELAQKELLELLNQIEMAEARKLLKIVQAQLAIASPPPPAPIQPAEGPQAENQAEGNEDRSGPVYAADLMPSEILSRDDVNIMRVYEIDFDHPPKVLIKPEAVRTLIEKYGTSKLIPASQAGRNAMFRAAADSPLDIVRLMFELKSRDLYPLVEVNSEPHALNMFRLRVHDTWLMNNCATSSCHGGPYAGPLFLHRRNYKDDRVRYTNLLILERLEMDPGWPLINYEKPEDSLIIQYGLPRELARKPHPDVTGWKPAFSPSNQKLRENAVEWIQTMMQPRPDYPVQYEAPRLPKSMTSDESETISNPSR